MKKIISFFSLFLFIIGGMYYTNKSIVSYQEQDPIMIKIKESALKYEVVPMDAVLSNNDIISGSYGRGINQKKSFYEMKKYGAYNELLTVFEEIKPNVSIEDHYDHYLIRGNGKRREVAFIFLLKEKKSISSLLSLLEKKKVKATFFVDGLLLEDVNFIKSLKSHEVELLNYDSSYEEVYFKTASSYLNTIRNKPGKFCFTDYENKELLNLCSSLKLHTIKGNIISKNLFSYVKNHIENSMIFPIDSYDYDELSISFDYLTKKGYHFVTAEELFLEQ